MVRGDESSAQSIVSIRAGGRELAVSCHSRIRKLHDEIFLQSPFTFGERASEEHEIMLTTIREYPTFSISVALLGVDVIGFTYGHRLPIDHKWWEMFATPA